MWVHCVLLGALYVPHGCNIFNKGTLSPYFQMGELCFTCVHEFSHWSIMLHMDALVFMGHYVSHGHLRCHMSTSNGYIML